MPKPRPSPKILAAQRYIISVNALISAAIIAGVLFLSTGGRAEESAVATTSAPDLVSNMVQVRALSPELAGNRLPVRLRGVFAGCTDSSYNGFVLCDEDTGFCVYVWANQNPLKDIRIGDRLEVEGRTNPGGFAPYVEATSVQRIGNATLPPARRASIGQLNDTSLDAQRVIVSGVVRECELIPVAEIPKPPPGMAPGDAAARAEQMKHTYKLKLADGNERVSVQVNAEISPAALVDAEVEVRALCFSQHNVNRQFLAPLLDMPPGETPKVLQPPLAEPFNSPAQSVASIRQFRPDSHFGHRIHVAGVVIYFQPGESFGIRDNDHALCVQYTGDETLHPGDVVDVLGFPVTGDYTPTLENAVFQKKSTGPAPEPIQPVNSANAIQHDADLVLLKAKLQAIRQVENNWILTLDWNGTLVEAALNSAGLAALPAAWQPGSRVNVSGICLLKTEKTGPVSGILAPNSFELRMRSAADLTVIQPPPWWTLKHVTYLLGTVTITLSILTGALVLLTRSRLKEQTRQRLMAEKEFAVILSERNRMAREIHDTLAQGLTAISFQLRVAKKGATEAGEFLNQHLDAAQELTRKSLADARDSIWNMRSQVLESNDLQGALASILTQMSEGPDCATELKVTGQPRRFAPVVENNLLRFGQESITNAIRHARAGKISVRLDFGEKEFRLSVEDDGCGFDVDNPPKSSGGFGLVGLRERAKELQGGFTLQSKPGEGTTVAITIPMGG